MVKVKEYSWESCVDMTEDIYTFLEELPEGEFTGTIKMTLEYINEE